MEYLWGAWHIRRVSVGYLWGVQIPCGVRDVPVGHVGIHEAHDCLVGYTLYPWGKWFLCGAQDASMGLAAQPWGA